jgi:hypothetical protein
MIRLFALLLVAGLGGSPLSATPFETAQTDSPSAHSQTFAQDDPSTTLRMRGTIEKYDPSVRVLSLSTTDGPMRFEITTLTRIHQGWRTIQARELERLTGFEATVRFSNVAGGVQVQSVRIARGARAR